VGVSPPVPKPWASLLALAWPVKKLVLIRFFDVVILFLLRSRFPALVPSGCDMVKAVHEHLYSPMQGELLDAPEDSRQQLLDQIGRVGVENHD
jgi:hypothetical protein